ncbi:hypothetical protein TNCV_4484861 [Trichonephila clavipes]|nr:hypothetical protein TNCV_4484861 [Trichonephila clavipes]
MQTGGRSKPTSVTGRMIRLRDSPSESPKIHCYRISTTDKSCLGSSSGSSPRCCGISCGKHLEDPAPYSPVPMGVLRQVFSAVFRVFTNHNFLQEHLRRIGVKGTPGCPL